MAKKKHKVKERNEIVYSLIVRKGGTGSHKDSRSKRLRTRLAKKIASLKDQEN